MGALTDMKCVLACKSEMEISEMTSNGNGRTMVHGRMNITKDILDSKVKVGRGGITDSKTLSQPGGSEQNKDMKEQTMGRDVVNASKGISQPGSSEQNIDMMEENRGRGGNKDTSESEPLAGIHLETQNVNGKDTGQSERSASTRKSKQYSKKQNKMEHIRTNESKTNTQQGGNIATKVVQGTKMMFGGMNETKHNPQTGRKVPMRKGKTVATDHLPLKKTISVLQPDTLNYVRRN